MLGHGHSHGAHANGGASAGYNPHGICLPCFETRQQAAQVGFYSAIACYFLFSYAMLELYGQLSLQTNNISFTLIIWEILFAFTVFLFFRTAFSDPGTPEETWWENDVEISVLMAKKKEQLLAEVARTNPDDANPEEYKLVPPPEMKPMRSHPCHETQSVVLKFDHFCLLLNVPIGYKNTKFFFLYLCYQSVFGLLSIYLYLNGPPSETWMQSIRDFIAWMITCAMTFWSCSQLYHTFWLIRNNVTTVEYNSYTRTAVVAHQLGISSPTGSVYDIGTFKNLQDALGTDVWFWILPTAPQLPHKGYRWEKNLEVHHALLERTRKIQEKRIAILNRQKLPVFKKGLFESGKSPV